jgi:hypothetical protein
MRKWYFLPAVIALPFFGFAQDQHQNEIHKTAYQVDGIISPSGEIVNSKPVAKSKSASVQKEAPKLMTIKPNTKRDFKKSHAAKYPNASARTSSADTIRIPTDYKRKKSGYRTKY